MTRPLRGVVYESRESDAYSVCAACEAMRPRDAFTDACPKGETHAPAPLRVEQRRLRWVDESSILARAALPNGRADPAVVLAGIVDGTVRSSNFGLNLDFLQTLEDQNLGWHLFRWLGAVELLEKYGDQGRRAQQEQAEAVQKKSAPQ